MNINGNLWISTIVHGYPWISMDFLDLIRGPCPATNEHPRRAMDMLSSQINALREIFNSR